MAPPFIPSVILEAGVASLPVVASEDSSMSVVPLQPGCEVVPGPKLTPATSVVSNRTAMLGVTEIATEEERVSGAVEDRREGEVMADEGATVTNTVEGSVHGSPSESMLRRVDVSECEAL